jgi:hypothetical protein
LRPRAKSRRWQTRCPQAGHFAFALLFALAVPIFAQTQAPKLADFSGTWKAEFKKFTWMTLTLKPETDSLSGVLTHSTYLSADNEGDLTSVGEEMSNDKVVKVQAEGPVLHITVRDDDGNEDRYNLTLTGPDSAELQPVSSDGAPVPKAFKLKRSVAAAQK